MQVVTIHKDGGVSGLQVKRGQGLDLKKLGEAEISRSSHVVFNATQQMWCIEFLTGPLAGEHVTWALVEQARIPSRAMPSPVGRVTEDAEGVLMFEDYEDAVALEHEVHQGYRLQGVFLCG